MVKEELVKAIINGKSVRLSKAAYKIASRFYGAVSEEDLKKARPAELERPLLRPTIKPVMIKPAIKEPEVKTPEMPAELQGDPMTEKVEETVESGGDPAAVVPGPSKSKRTPAKKAKK